MYVVLCFVLRCFALFVVTFLCSACRACCGGTQGRQRHPCAGARQGVRDQESQGADGIHCPYAGASALPLLSVLLLPPLLLSLRLCQRCGSFTKKTPSTLVVAISPNSNIYICSGAGCVTIHTYTKSKWCTIFWFVPPIQCLSGDVKRLPPPPPPTPNLPCRPPSRRLQGVLLHAGVTRRS